MNRIDELQEQQRTLVAFRFERLDEGVKLGYGLVELHIASSISSSFSSITRAEALAPPLVRRLDLDHPDVVGKAAERTVQTIR